VLQLSQKMLKTQRVKQYPKADSLREELNPAVFVITKEADRSFTVQLDFMAA